MDNRRAKRRATYNTPIGHTVKTLDKPKALKKGVSDKPKKKKRETYATKAGAIIAWFDELRSRKMQLALFKAGRGESTFKPWEFEYIPNLFKEAKRLISNTKYLKMRLEAKDQEIPIYEYYAQKGLRSYDVKKAEAQEAEIVFWAIEHYEKKYGGTE